MTAIRLHILRHSLGLDEEGHGHEYRNYFATAPDCDEHGDVAALCGVVCPELTRSQRRYQRFLDADSGMSFGEWLKCGSAAAAERKCD